MLRRNINAARRGVWMGVIAALIYVMRGSEVWAAQLSSLSNVGFASAASALPIGEADASGVVFGLFVGVMLTAAVYLFFIWIVIHDRGQVFLMLLLLCLAANMASTNAPLMSMIGVESATMRNLLQSYSMILAYIFSIFFTNYFLEMDVHMPRFRLPLFVLAGLLLLLLVYAVFDQRPVHFALPTIGTLTVIGILLAGLGMLYQRVSGSLTHIIAFAFFMVGGLAEPLYDLGYLADATTSNHIAYSAFSLAALMFAIVIAGQFAARQEEKERALGVSNERFALAARGSNEGLFDWNLATQEVFFSDQFKKILGLRHQDGGADALKSWLKMIAPRDRGTIFRHLHRFRKDPRATVINFEYRVTGADGEKRWIHTKTVATRDPTTGDVLRFVGSTGDITARKRGEAALKASEARFRSITEAHPVPVLIVRLSDNQIVYASPSSGALMGLKHEILTNYKLERFLRVAEERQDISAAIGENRDINLKEVAVTQGDGTQLPAALSARRIAYQNEAAMVIGLYDLTERKSAEAQIAQQKEALQQSEKMAALGGLLAGVAHELNNPLSVIVGQSTLLMEGAEEPKVKTRAEKIHKAADRCSRIVKSFLALARRKPPERKAVDINAIISASLELLSYQFRNENVAVKLDLAPNLPNVNGDGDQLTQVFTNLALNAAQALHDWAGERQMTIHTAAEGDKVVIRVVDTGPGIAPELRSRVFEPFFTTKGSSGGTGVGLALCLNIIETHGGQMRLESTTGHGATFTIALPAVSAEALAREAEPAVRVELPDRLKILLVDDEVELAQTLADLLAPEGHDIAIAINGAVALEKLRQRDFDVIVSDLRMPVLDGPGLYAGLAQSLPQYLHRIIYVTGDTLSPHVQSFLSQTPVPVIEKPYRLADVRGAIAGLLKENASKRMMGGDDSTAPPP